MTGTRARLPAAERRRQLLGVALSQFGARGFHQTSMDDIAEAAGVTKPVLYQHFSSKQDLYRQLLTQVGGELLDGLEQAAAAEHDGFQRVLAGLRAYFAFVAERTSAFEMLFGRAALRTGEFADAIRAVEVRAAAAVASFIDANIGPDYRDLLAFAIVGAAEVASREWVIRSPGATLDPAEGEQLARRLAGLLWAGLRSLPADTARP